MKKVNEEPPPKSTDLDGWRQAITDNRLNNLRLETIAAAFQDLGERDVKVRNTLAKHLSDSIIHMLRGRVGTNHPNRGEDIILRIHGQIFEALLRPKSADGRNLREAFGCRVIYRMKDALAAEERARRVPDEDKPKKKHKIEQEEAPKDAEEVEIINLAKHPDFSEESELREGEAMTPPEVMRDASLLNSIRDTDEKIDVDRILECISDYKKRLAFWLFMNDVPYASKRKGVSSIAQAVGISEKTARDWIIEIQTLLKENNDVKYLKKLRAGDET